MLDWIATIAIMDFISIVEVNKNRFKSNKMTYHSMTWFFYNRIINLKQNHLIVQTKLKALPKNEISRKISLTVYS